jgi:DNA modification methylase
MSFQPKLFDFDDFIEDNPEGLNRANLGTFQDSLNAPVHNWFTYPAGFSYKAVEEAIRLYQIKPGMVIYDPFAGTGTTNIVASQNSIDSFGVEAHPFVHFIAHTKLYWEFDLLDLRFQIENLINVIRQSIKNINSIQIETIFPELVLKCYSREKLIRLYLCREAINNLSPSPFQDFAKVGLTSLLRSAADVATGWPYIAPQKAKKPTKTNSNLNIADLLRDQLYRMRDDLQKIRSTKSQIGNAKLILGDSRQQQSLIESESVDLAFTSPPYLNNYDYADRTRLEMYFWGEAENWGDITHKVRTQLMMSATTQINRSAFNMDKLLSDDFQNCVPQLAAELLSKISKLSELRLEKGGKKSYDILVAGYFNDSLQVLREAFRVLRPKSSFLLILGDSAPYGVYIPTHTYLGEIAKAVGFSDYKVEQLRTRGQKWKDNPQRHKVALQECILTLYKD